MPHDDFWKLPPAARETRPSRLTPLPLYEAQQPPLTYFLFAIPYRIFESEPLEVRVWVLRLLAALIASLAIPIAFRAGGFAVAAIIASMPELYIVSVRVSNEALAVTIGSACILVWMRLEQKPARAKTVIFGLLLAAALLTKAYFLALLAAVPFASRARRYTFASLAIALTIAAPWYIRNLAVTGTVTGQFEDASAQSAWKSILDVPWLKIADFALLTHIWLGGWSFIELRSWMYRAAELLLLAAAVGLAVKMFRGQRDLRILTLPQVFLWTGLAYHGLVSYVSHGGGTVGYYAYSLIVAEAMCIVIGLGARFAAPAAVTLFTALELYGTNFLLMPYYSGFITHPSGGNVRAMHLSQLSGGGAQEMFRRLAFAKPLSSAVLAGLWAIYIVATIALVVITVVPELRKQPSEPQPLSKL